ncbi:alpha/beta hydrolase [Mycobacterium sp. 21AC1]|uniref:alpha/beta hydrolase n=1 Tax=[Mycobacterium] appelbergii TaxID=2939269 RepID=UPI0029391B9F|nr:alpha/beta hydrolase [Mycobacterium sp. 21AC1]MDV3123618.1 alpha/beta hydrolase [Mycobacterium sp. 21AC1]
MREFSLEPAAQEFADAAARPPFVYEMSPSRARTMLEAIQGGPVTKPAVDSTWVAVVMDGVTVRTRIVKPVGWTRLLPVVLYLHGGGWVLGNAGTHDRLVRELAVGVPAAIAFVDYDRAPEARYPVALEQAYATARWLLRNGGAWSLDPTRLAVAGDSAGGNMAAVLALLAKRRGDVSFIHQSLYYPVTDAAQNTGSYFEFADGPHLTARAMAWFWDCYLPDIDMRRDITASPLRATYDQLTGLPEALVIVDEYDVLRDEGEEYARRLVTAGVRCTCVRYASTFHDFMLLNPLRRTAAATAAISQAIQELRRAFYE